MVALIFAFSLITSHYGVSYIFMLSIIFTSFIIYIYYGIKKYYQFLTPKFTMLFCILAIGWYMYISAGSKFEVITNVSYHVISNISKILHPEERSGIYYALYMTPTILWYIYKFIHLILLLFITVGVIGVVFTTVIRRKAVDGIVVMSIVFYGFLLFQVTKGFNMGFDRALQITLTLISPFALIGCIFIFKLVKKYQKKKNSIIDMHIIQKVFAIFLSIFILFSSGFIFEIAQDRLPPYCIALNKSAGWPVYDESEVNSILWLRAYKADHDIAVFNIWHMIKSRDGLLVAEFYPAMELIRVSAYTTNLTNSYIFLGKYSMKKVNVGGRYINLKDTIFYSNVLIKSNKIYSSGNATIYLS